MYGPFVDFSKNSITSNCMYVFQFRSIPLQCTGKIFVLNVFRFLASTVFVLSINFSFYRPQALKKFSELVPAYPRLPRVSTSPMTVTRIRLSTSTNIIWYNNDTSCVLIFCKTISWYLHGQHRAQVYSCVIRCKSVTYILKYFNGTAPRVRSYRTQRHTQIEFKKK